MKIQVITGNKNLVTGDSITFSDYSSPMSPDNFDVNVIDLSYIDLWKSIGSTPGRIDNYNDLKFISKMISDSDRAGVVYVYPQDEDYKYDYSNNSYREKMRIKDLINNESFYQDYKACFPLGESIKSVVFEPTKTTIGKVEYTSAFRFDHVYVNIITESDNSNKVTTIKSEDGHIFTTLDICSSVEKLQNFLDAIFGEDDVSDVPDWVREYEFGNDSLLKASIESSNKKIDELQQIINDANNQLADNNKYKSILVNNGVPLVKVVFEILEKLLDCDLSEFVDESREDFRIEKDGIVFIGEIKGITSNVKNENISQLDVHYQSYLDEIENEPQNINAKAILIINPLRNKRLEEREPVNERQIKLANRNGSLIIETITLLKIYELYIDGLLSPEMCIQILTDKTGLLSINDFEEDK